MMTLTRQLQDLTIILNEIKGRHDEIVCSDQYEAIQQELNQAVERLGDAIGAIEYKGIMAPFVRLPPGGHR